MRNPHFVRFSKNFASPASAFRFKKNKFDRFKKYRMPLSHILVVYLISVLIVFLPSFGLAKMFQKAGVPQWKAYVPFYNTWVMQDLAKRPKHWVFWQLIPVVG